MNKQNLVAQVSIDLDISKREASDAVESVLEAIKRAVRNGEKVVLPGFGTFEKRKRAARTARNPRTGATINVPATSVPAFRAGKEFKEAVAGKKNGKKNGRKKASRRR